MEQTIKPLELKDLKPKNSFIELNGVNYELRPVTLDDWVWMAEHFGQDPADKLAKAIPLGDMVRVCYRLLLDKSDFLAETIENEIDDDGEIVESRRVTGPEKFRKALIGFNGVERLAKAFTECLGVADLSEEDLEEMANRTQKKRQKKKA